MNGTLTALDGIKVGHWTHTEAQTGCTVVLCPPAGCVASGYVLGAAPGSRELALLEPSKTVERVNAVVLTGGSAFGLAVADGVMAWLESQNIGFETPFGVVPIVPSAVIYDLASGDARIRPDAAAGLAAAKAATAQAVTQGRVGAGTGALVGKYLGFDKAARGGLGSALLEVGGAKVAALTVCNAVGDIFDPDTHERVAGAVGKPDGFDIADLRGMNTTLVVATDALLTKAQAHLLSQSAQIGIARVTRPSHTVQDGDTTFVLSTGKVADVSQMVLSIAVQSVVAQAIVRGVRLANA